jgi:Cu(I)/Ag(I) efflux system membrane protein CusA/SilA
MMEGAEGKLFKPLAFTKTFALIASLIVALTILPPFARVLFTGKIKSETIKRFLYFGLLIVGLISMLAVKWWIGLVLTLIAGYHLLANRIPAKQRSWIPRVTISLTILIVVLVLTEHWLPLGPGKGIISNLFFVVLLIGVFLSLFWLFYRNYSRILNWALVNKLKFISIPLMILMFGGFTWLGFDSFFGWFPNWLKTFKPVSAIAHAFPGMGKEFMPTLDEGSYLYMPTTMPHASIGEVLDVLQYQDKAISAIPEVSEVVGKLGRAETPLDPAPVSMIETVINYHSEYIVDKNGNYLTFFYDSDSLDYHRDRQGNAVLAPDGLPYYVRGKFIRDDNNNLIEDSGGRPFRLWRQALDPDLNKGRVAWPGIKSANDIWDEIIAAAEVPGTTSAPKLQPIATRIVMLQSGMRAPMGIKVKGPDLITIENVGLKLEKFLKEVPSIESATVFADRIVGKPYLEIEIDRRAIARYGIKLQMVQEIIETAIGGKQITTTVEGRERYPVRVRYMRELRDNIESLDKILVPAPAGAQIPIIQLAKINYVRGPQVIKSEDTFLIGYVLFDMKPGYAEVDVVEQARDYLQQKLESGEFDLPAGVSYSFAGSYENQVRAEKKLMVILPLALFIIFLILYFHFKSVSTTGLVFSGIAVAWAGGFIMLWLYGQDWFMNFSFLGNNIRELFQMHTYNLSVAVWVGFLALFGIATDDGVVIGTYLKQTFAARKPTTVNEIREATVIAGQRRVRPALMTTATTVLALMPVLTSTGRGSDIMVPMAIPSFGGMIFAVITMLIVPVLYAWIEELKITRKEIRHK